jgi:hypothetical protein
MTDTATATSLPTSRKVLCVAYVVIAVVALITTWINVGPYIHDPTDFFVTFWRDTRVNAASRFITADALTLALSAAVLVVVEGRRHRVRFIWAYIVGSYFVAVSVAFPLFLIARELRIASSEGPRPRMVDTILLAALAVFIAGLTIWVAV